ncbi:MAG: primosomal protein N', partial [Phycisphaerales bacterium JB038]
AILHSGLTAAQRHQEWRRVAAGEVAIVVGARSAVFAPFPAGKLGLLIVDEEHDGSYKQDQAPRYHARDVAIRRGQLEEATVVLGSATPSLESYHNARQGRYRLHELRQRPTGATLPRVEIVDFVKANRERPRDRRIHLLTPRLEQAMLQTVRAGGQAMLLLNRRGFANYICCPDHRCGWRMTCRHCDTTMVYHLHRKRSESEQSGGDVLRGNTQPGAEDRGSVRCHHCQAQQRLPRDCPVCGKRVTAFGFGTQRVEEELARLLPDLEASGGIARLDSDTMRRAEQYHEILDRFAAGDIRLLVGTQMIAKGLDFPNVRLVGVVNADTALNLPDFRAAERTFQLVSQVAGRSGRAEHTGLVVVQTLQPDAAPIVHAARHDYRGFAEAELAMRARVHLPPSTRLARVVVRHREHGRAQEGATVLAAGLRRLLPDHEGLRLHGPMPCPISRIADKHRQAVEILAPTATALQRFLTAARNAKLLHADAGMAIDVDPIALL